MMKRLLTIMLAVSAALPLGNVQLAHADTVTVGGNFGGNRTYTSPLGPQVLVQGDPSGFRVGNGKEFAYRITASDADGVDRIDLYINDARIKTCYSSVCEYRNTYWVNGGTSRLVKFWTRTTDKRGYSTETSGNPNYLTVDAYSSATAGGTVTNTGGSVLGTSDASASLWTSLDPNTTALNANQSIAFNVNAQDADGLRQIDVYANGAVIRTCTFNNTPTSQTCSVSVFGNNYSQGTNIILNAKATDQYGVTSWTTSTTLYRSNDGSVYNNGGSGNSMASVWNNTSMWTVLDPNTTTLNAHQNVAFTVNAQDGDGLQRIEIFVNGFVRRACEFGTVYGTVMCDTRLFANDYTPGTNITANARITDGFGNAIWSNTTTLVRANNGSVLGTSDASASVWTTLDPNTTTLNVNQNVAFTVNAQDADGLQRIEIFVNGFVRRACELGTVYGTAMCDTRLFANDYNQGTNVTANARITDRFGNATWSNTTTLVRANDGSSNNNNTINSAGLSAWSWFEPGTLSRNASTQFRAGAWAERGLSSIELWVNGSVKRTCWFNTAFGNQSCDVTVYGNDYNTGSNISANAKATDRDGKVTWSDLRTITVTNTDGTSFGSNGNGNISISSDRNGTFRVGDQISFWTNGSDVDGIDRVEIYVNAVRTRVCYGTASCSVTVGPFANRGGVSYAATLFDLRGNSVTTGYQQVTLVQ